MEASLLASLEPRAVRQRCTELYEAGWTLDAIGKALTPPRGRSTVRAWINSPLTSSVTLPPPPLPTARPAHQSVSSTARATIPEYLATRIRELAPVARNYRARTASTSSAAVANRELTRICADLHAAGVTTAQLARAAGVTYRAMARRLGR
jgi:hypothetical protein